MDLTLYNNRQAFIEKVSNDVAKQLLDNMEGVDRTCDYMYKSSADLVFSQSVSNIVMKMIEDATEFKLISSGVINEVKMKKKNALTIHYEGKGRWMKQNERSEFGLDQPNVDTPEDPEINMD